MRCKAPGPPQCEHCKGRATPQRADQGHRHPQFILGGYLGGIRNILETRNLSQACRDVTAVDNVSPQVRAGHIHALIGPNRAGKTTCFKLLTKFLVPTTGQILFTNRDITQAEQAWPIRSAADCAARIAAHASVRCRLPHHE
jgi:ABC-type multidrug transport system fused ATPase/permease subunit